MSMRWARALSLALLFYSPMMRAQENEWNTAVASGSAAYQQGRYSEAEKYFADALSKAETFGPSDIRLATTLNNLAQCDRQLGRYNEAEQLYLRAAKISETVRGAEDLEYATVIGNLGELYVHTGRYKEAEPLLERSLRIREKSLPRTDPRIAFSLQELSALYRQEVN